MEYIIKEVEGVYDSKFPDSKRYVLRLQDQPHSVSVFSKFPLAIGGTIQGEIVQNGQYWNFKFTRKEESKEFQVGNAEIKNLINLKVFPLLVEILERQKGTFVEKLKYPVSDSSNDAHDFYDIPDRNTDEFPF